VPYNIKPTPIHKSKEGHFFFAAVNYKTAECQQIRLNGSITAVQPLANDLKLKLQIVHCTKSFLNHFFFSFFCFCYFSLSKKNYYTL
jgi:hypothetical protein